jgi:hypothetical protein
MTETPEQPLPGEGTEIGRLFTRIVTDPEFKQLLLTDPDTALQGYDLSQAQIMMVKTLDADDFDKLTPENLTEYFSADAAVYTPDEADLADDEAYSAEDFLDEENFLDEADEYDVGDEKL